MLENRNIVCFSSARWEYPGLQQTIMRLLSKKNRILFFNSIGTRRISVDYAFFLAVIRRITRAFEGSRDGCNNIFIYNPRSIPFAYNSLIARLNSVLISRQCRNLIRQLDFSPYILWLGSPMAAPLLDVLEPCLTVYNPVDRYHAFAFVDPDKILALEQKIAEKANVILCTSEAIKNDLLPLNGSTHNVSHGVDFEHFNSALLNDVVPEDIKHMKRPIIGYFGGLSERVNYTIIAGLAAANMDATILLIGPKLANLSEIEKYPNVHILEYKRFDILPQYLKEFDVCLVPYHVNKLMDGVDPIKLKEYFCLGKPVVSTDLPEVRKYDGLVYIGRDEDDFIIKVRAALQEKDDGIKAERIKKAKESDWSIKVEEISVILDEAFLRTDSGLDI